MFLNFFYCYVASLECITLKIIDRVNDNLFLKKLQKSIETEFSHVRLVVDDVNLICKLNCFVISNDINYKSDEFNFIQFSSDNRPISSIIRNFMFARGIEIGYYMPFMPCECISNMFLITELDLMVSSSCKRETVILSTSGSQFQIWKKKLPCFVTFFVKFTLKLDLMFCDGGLVNYVFDGVNFTIVKNLEFNSSIISGNFNEYNVLVVHSNTNSFHIQNSGNNFKYKVLQHSEGIFENGFDFFLNFKTKPIFMSKNGHFGYYNQNRTLESEKFSNIGMMFLRSEFKNIVPNNSCDFKFIGQATGQLNMSPMVDAKGYSLLYISMVIVIIIFACCLLSAGFLFIFWFFNARSKMTRVEVPLKSEYSSFGLNLCVENTNTNV